MYETKEKERALLVVVEERDERWSRDALAEEFKNLVLSAGIEVVELVFVKGRQPTPSLFIGKGKAEELGIIAQEENVNVVIFNNNLNFNQQRNLEDIFGVKTIDRTQLILDIFARHARTQEGILQVELAQLEYLLPRLKGKGIMLSRLGAGIGTRGPGEKKLEVDRRRISERIVRLKRELEEVKQHRQVMRKKREKTKVLVCSLVGYINAGKSTIFNALTESTERVSNSLFTTLDTVTHTFTLPNNLKAILSDTVGFIYKLPPYLVEAFKATLEELHYADLILHVIDASDREIARIRQAVDSIMEELGLTEKPTLMVFNKIDKLSSHELKELQESFPEAVFVSALEKNGLDFFKEAIYESVSTDIIEAVIRLPFTKMGLASQIHDQCTVLKTQYEQEEAVYWVRTKQHNLDYFKKQGAKIKEIE
ncbi:MAG: GTPase HflX [Candidatus Omnitrophota bacterium]|nr:MAG: GTPase HflX [Candidatus Omnitrophota bacterium]